MIALMGVVFSVEAQQTPIVQVPSGAINVQRLSDGTAIYQMRDVPGRWFVQTRSQTIFFDFRQRGPGLVDVFCNNMFVRTVGTAALGQAITAGMAMAGVFPPGLPAAVAGVFVSVAATYGIYFLCR